MAYKFTKEFYDNAMTFGEYMSLTERLVSEKKTTGTEQTADRIELTKLNYQRMKRIYITTELIPEWTELFAKKDIKYKWIVISEPWCGDNANTTPVLAKIAEASETIELRIILRDENPDVMNEYLTDNTKSIPVLIVLDGEFNEICVWGARPAGLQDFVKDFKSMPGYDSDELKKQIQMWYINDKTVSAQKEIYSTIINSVK
ncbi:MAG: thioredoxin family protein [Ignavibacteria bacterium]|nr:thioredoxin family protein [Ignavibacteria bacterium]